jgi:hypothetical protein
MGEVDYVRGEAARMEAESKDVDRRLEEAASRIWFRSR